MESHIVTERLLLRNYRERDLEKLHMLKSDPLVWKFSSNQVTNDVESSKMHLESILNNYKDGNHDFQALYLRSTDEYIGEAGILSVNKKNHRAVIGYNLIPKYWGKGYATEITIALTQYLFEQENFERIEALVLEENIASRRVLEKAGFIAEGLLRNFTNIDHKYCNVYYYGITRNDFKAVHSESSTAVAPKIESNRLILRPFTIDDVDDVHLFTTDDLVTQYLNWPSCKDKSETEEAVKNYYIDKKGVFAIELKSEKKCIGCIDLRIFPEHEKGSFGFVLNRSYWNNNYMTEALELILDVSFSKLKLNRVEATHYVGNEGSGRVMQKCGMKYEGTGIKEVKIKGIFQDVVHYAILKEQWIRSKTFEDDCCI